MANYITCSPVLPVAGLVTVLICIYLYSLSQYCELLEKYVYYLYFRH